MDIYSFLNSQDIAEHCRNINKTWNLFEKKTDEKQK